MLPRGQVPKNSRLLLLAAVIQKKFQTWVSLLMQQMVAEVDHVGRLSADAAVGSSSTKDLEQLAVNVL